MHEFVRDRLEELLAAEQLDARLPVVHQKSQEVKNHLNSCAECSSEIAFMRAQAEALRTLRAPVVQGIEPGAGFYARVIQRIEQRSKNSIWSVFVDSPFGKRLAYTSLAIAALFGSYVVTLEARDGHLGGQGTVAQQLSADEECYGSQAQQRDAVLVNFASSQRTLQ